MSANFWRKGGIFAKSNKETDLFMERNFSQRIYMIILMMVYL